MKRLISVCMFFFLASVVGYAQKGNVTVSIKLFPIQIIEINPVQENVSLSYLTTEDYENGVKTDQHDHLSLYSTGGFVVKVMTMETDLSSTFGNKIPVNDITVTPLAGSTNPLVGAEYSSVNLSNEAKVIVANNTGGINKTFGINYRAKGNNEYVNKYVNTESPSVFRTNVVYSIEVR